MLGRWSLCGKGKTQKNKVHQQILLMGGNKNASAVATAGRAPVVTPTATGALVERVFGVRHHESCFIYIIPFEPHGNHVK